MLKQLYEIGPGFVEGVAQELELTRSKIANDWLAVCHVIDDGINIKP